MKSLLVEAQQGLSDFFLLIRQDQIFTINNSKTRQFFPDDLTRFVLPNPLKGPIRGHNHSDLKIPWKLFFKTRLSPRFFQDLDLAYLHIIINGLEHIKRS